MPSAIRSVLLLALVLSAGLPALTLPARGAPAGAHQKDKGTGLPVPRFVTLRSAEVNARSGPGVRYPVEWVFLRKEMPVEITAEFDTWRRIRDWEGSEGWVHQSMLSGKRAVVITGDVRPLRRDPNATASVVARAQPGAMGWLGKCQGGWCEVKIKGYRGWLQRNEFWGVYADERIE
jgi:SH3-like domain-containing protein